MCNVSGGVQLLKDVAGLAVTPVTFLSSKVADSRAVLLDEESSSSDDSSDDEAPKQPKQIPLARTTHPQTLTFTAPADAAPGKPVCLQGPHGPIRVPLPADVQPNRPTSIRLGPPDHYTTTVPEGAAPGSTIHFTGQGGEQLHAQVPPGAKQGDELKVSPPVVLVQVPQGAKPGHQVAYDAPNGQRLFAVVPPNVAAGHYFSALFELQQSPQQAPQEAAQAPPVMGMSMEPRPPQSQNGGYAAQKAERQDDLKALLEDAVRREDYASAAKFKAQIESKDCQAEKLDNLKVLMKDAARREDYAAAAKFKAELESLEYRVAGVPGFGA